MLLKRRAPRLEDQSPELAPGLPELPSGSAPVLAWLTAHRLDFVLVGAVAEAIRCTAREPGPVAIVPAPYLRNLERLARALSEEEARTRVSDQIGTIPARLTPDRLMSDGHWSLRCGEHDIDVETRSPFRCRYQELLYEAESVEVAPEVRVQVAGVEDLERYAALRRGRALPEIRISRAAVSLS